MLFMKMSASPIIFFAMARPSGSFRLSDTQFLLVLFKSMVGSSVSVSSQPKPGPWVRWVSPAKDSILMTSAPISDRTRTVAGAAT